MKGVECELLHHWRFELEESRFIVNPHPFKSQKHVDALSRMPIDPEEEEEELGL